MTTKADAQAVPGTLTELREMLKGFDTAMLSSVTADGSIRARPMELQDFDERPASDLWFVTSIDSPKIGEIENDRHVGVSCFKPSDRSYLSISALATVTRDRSEIRRLFKPSWKMWFPNGPDDPTIALLDLRIQRAEYWEPEGGRMRILFEMVKARMTGESADLNLNPPKKIG